MGKESSSKSEDRQVSHEKKHKDTDEKPKKHEKQHTNYSKLEGGENARISAEDLGELVSERDTDAIEKYGGVKVLHIIGLLTFVV